MEEFSAAEEMQFVWNLGHRMESSILGSGAVVVVPKRSDISGRAARGFSGLD